MGMGPQLKVSSDRLVKPTTPGLQSEWFIYNTTVTHLIDLLTLFINKIILVTYHRLDRNLQLVIGYKNNFI